MKLRNFLTPDINTTWKLNFIKVQQYISTHVWFLEIAQTMHIKKNLVFVQIES
jgi:hypothetical protein